MQDFALSKAFRGARNLLVACGGCQPGQQVLFVHEHENDGYYDPELLPTLQRAAVMLGLQVHTHAVPLLPDCPEPDAHLAARMAAADCTVFLARLGDQLRFRPADAGMRQIIPYTLDLEMLESDFGTLPYAAFETLRDLLDSAVAGANHIEISCPAGTNVQGGPVHFQSHGRDVTRKRFPVSVAAPVPARSFTGRIAQRGFLTGTGSRYFAPWSCGLDETLYVNFEGNRITGFEGDSDDVARAQAHYAQVAGQFGLAADYVHSWHAGIHPGCAYLRPAGDHMPRWSGSAFGNPRLLHFHTCGDTPPGEISLNVVDPTVRLDGVAVWENGRLYPDRVPGGQRLLAAYPDVAAAFEAPRTEVGLGPAGALSLYPEALAQVAATNASASA